MPRIAIVTDSTANLSAGTNGFSDLYVVPLKIHWDSDTFIDGVDLTLDDFYSRLAANSHLPTTSQPASQDFFRMFDALAPRYDGILVLLISSGISGTVASAQSAAAEFTQVPVEVVDTHSTTAGLALVVLAAAEAAAGDCSLDEVARKARDVAQKLHFYFAVDTLKYLHKGGRIGGASRYLGTALSIKPILTINEDGKIDALERVRTKQKALARLIGLAQEKAGGRSIRLGIMHGHVPQEAEEFRANLEKQLQCKCVYTFEISPVIGTHAGPGAIGIAFYVD